MKHNLKNSDYLVNSDLDLENAAKIRNEIKEQFLSSKKVREVLGWKPSHSLNQGLSETFEWYSNFFEGKTQ